MSRLRRRTAAGTALLLAGTAILMGIVTAEALYPAPYHTDENTISDLGGTRPPDGVVLQPSAAIFDTTMVVTGLGIIVAAYLLYRGLDRRTTTAVAAGLLGVGVLGVGVFPGDTAPHPAFAMLAFVAGGVAAVASSRALAPPLRHVFAADGVVALAALGAGLFLLDWAPVAALGAGGVERWVAYPVVLWLVGFGAYLCHGVPPGGRTSSSTPSTRGTMAADGRPYDTVRMPAMRVAQRDVLTFLSRERAIHALVEADVTDARAAIAAARRCGVDVSFTAFVVACLARTIAENWSVQAFPVGRRRLFVPHHVDVNTQIERVMDGHPVDVPVIIRDAQTKPVTAITAEIRAAQHDAHPATYPQRMLRWYGRVPRALRAVAWRGLRRLPRLASRAGGTVAVTSVGMFVHRPGWAIPVSASPLAVAVGGITALPRVVDGAVRAREVLALTVSLDHDAVDGAPAARFIGRFLSRMERADGLPDGRPVAPSASTAPQPAPQPQTHQPQQAAGQQ